LLEAATTILLLQQGNQAADHLISREFRLGRITRSMEEFGPAPIRNYAYPALPNVNLFQLNRLG
jgi:hypothetical protein